MDYQREKFSQELFDEVLPLLKLHWEELAHYKDIPLEPDTETYEKVESLGMLRIYTARHFDVLHGYAVFFVRPNPHYRSSIQAGQDIIYMCPEMRKGVQSVKFIKWCEGELKDEGVQIIYWHEKIALPFNVILRRMGYQAIETSWSKRLN